VRTTGDPARPPVLLVHGYPDSSAVWDGVVAALAARHRVITYDVRGAGASSAPSATAGYRLEHLAADLATVIDATSPGRPVHVVGHDWGAIQCWEAVAAPDAARRIASFTAISGPCLDHVGHWLRARLRHDLPALGGQALRSWYIGAFAAPGVADVAWRAGLGRAWPRFLERVEGVTAAPARDQAADGQHGLALYRANMAERFLKPRPRPVDRPVLLLVPTHDHYVGSEVVEAAAPFVPRLWRQELVAGHWVQLSHPEVLARRVAEWVEHIESGHEPPALRRARVTADQRPFAGQLAVVTGGGAGIGRATALALAERGAEVVVADLDLAGARVTAELCALLGASAHPRALDVADSVALEAFAENLEHELGTPDLVVNNAGIGVAGPFLATTPREWERLFAVNLNGVATGCRVFARQMVEAARAGHIVNLASAAAFAPSRSLPAYATSKAAVLMLSRCLRAELAGQDIGVSAICPGLVDTGITRSTRFAGADQVAEEFRRRAAAQLYRRRGLTAEHVADAIVDAIVHDRAVVHVGAEATVLSWLYRFTPGLSQRLARVDVASRSPRPRRPAAAPAEVAP
jgi:NAD(P)-dependent dehydrogenase (short-subunit alcohol dehydrogenase family)/pimeloyl-ACP methyl ester carboxylesterase